MNILDLEQIIEKYTKPENKKILEAALLELEPGDLLEYEEIIELWKTYGGS